MSIRHKPMAHQWAEFQGFVISGGDDIHPSVYGDEPDPALQRRYDRQRDKLELQAIDFALKNHLPILGICRGHQLLNVHLGGKLHTNLRPLRANTPSKNTVLPKRQAVVTHPGLLGDTLGLAPSEGFRINSLHNQAVRQAGEGLQVVATDLDGFAQATQVIEPKGPHRLLSVQWHPEYLWYLPMHLGLFKWLVGEASKP